VYLYRAVEFSGATIDFLLSAKRDAAAAERFLANNLARREPSGAAEALEENCRRSTGAVPNVLEQDHRPIKRRVRASQHFRSFWGAWHTIAGYEAIHMIRKGQACWSAAGAKVGLLHRFILGCSFRRAKFPIIYPELQLDYSCDTSRIATPAVPAIIHFEEIPLQMAAT
jgi:putative transposase